MLAVLVSLFHVLGSLSAMDAVVNTRTAQGVIACGVTLVAFPYLAVPAYWWVLGRSRRHSRIRQPVIPPEL